MKKKKLELKLGFQNPNQVIFEVENSLNFLQIKTNQELELTLRSQKKP